MDPARLDENAVASIATERIDWRFKGMPDGLAGKTLAEASEARPNLFRDGFLPPLVVLSEDALEHNLRTMAEWTAAQGLLLAPHGKTPMAPQFYQRQLAAGAWAITAANASQLRVYRAFGVSRILLANQLVDSAALAWLTEQLNNDPGFEFLCWADTVEGVKLLTEGLSGVHRPVEVLVELGAPGGRTGARDLAAARAVAEAVVASPVLRLAGTGGYEGAIAHGDVETASANVRAYLSDMVELLTQFQQDGLFEGAERVVLTAGGSAWPDLVAEAFTAFAPTWRGPELLAVLRSGAYLTHDDGFYRGITPFGPDARLSGTTALRPALHGWAQVSSRPEPRLALLTAGKRDFSYDEGLPEPQLRRHGDEVTELTGCVITKMNDQHAFLELTRDDQVEVGDWVRLGLSHPCTVFDKWQLLPVLAADGETVTGFVRTYF
ncbi:D-serine deaminase-like pyridoxal phosphate-dependent protein [Crossiella equi]|uniref:D-serine deaminase-like pyridoxal phosphate-dependent protein n=1 Tax=Crossiella equi TaxID=130796 RepID=A0ABS5A9R0_9PSEU|nr:alanine racemase [Crossiella equi]MBP2473306.1 D-serine deaminase-like pyridoxal phosphate-dependent protein [Crossiella equi]